MPKTKPKPFEETSGQDLRLPPPIRVSADLIGLSPISFSKPFTSEKKTNERPDAFDKRCWQEHLNRNAAGQVAISPTGLHKGYVSAAKYLPMRIPGQGTSTYTKHIESGVLITEWPVVCDLKGEPVVPEDVEMELLFMSSTGKKKGDSPKVWRRYPTVRHWQAHTTFDVYDPVLIQAPDVCEHYLEVLGRFIGLHRFRKENGGYYGLFKVENWKVTPA